MVDDAVENALFGYTSRIGNVAFSLTTPEHARWALGEIAYFAFGLLVRQLPHGARSFQRLGINTYVMLRHVIRYVHMNVLYDTKGRLERARGCAGIEDSFDFRSGRASATFKPRARNDS